MKWVTIQVWWQMAESNILTQSMLYSDEQKDNTNLKNWSQGEKFAAMWSTDLWNYMPNSSREWSAITRKDACFCTCDINITNWCQISNLSNKSRKREMQNIRTHVVKITQRWNLSLSSGGVTVQHLTCDVHVRVQPRAWLHKKLP